MYIRERKLLGFLLTFYLGLFIWVQVGNGSGVVSVRKKHRTFICTIDD